MPAWIIDDPTVSTGTGDAILTYWRKACEAEECRQLSPDQYEYYRVKETPYAPNQEKEAYRVCHSSISGASEQYAKRLQRRIWKDFLYRQRRWMSSPGGELRVTKDPVRDLGMEYHYEEFDGWMREWYVYIPQSVQHNPNKKVPLVLAMHGYTCTGEIYAGNSGWYDVAEKHGFIVVFPSALHAKVNMPEQGLMPDWAPLNAWNVFLEDDRPDELKFFVPAGQDDCRVSGGRAPRVCYRSLVGFADDRNAGVGTDRAFRSGCSLLGCILRWCV